MKKTSTLSIYFFIFIFLMISASAWAAPDKPSNISKKSIKSEYRYIKVDCKCAPMKEYKKLTGYNRNLNKSKKTH